MYARPLFVVVGIFRAISGESPPRTCGLGTDSQKKNGSGELGPLSARIAV